MKKYSVCESYKLAKDDIRTFFSNFEAEKFLLLVNESTKIKIKGKKAEHKCFPITQFRSGDLVRIGKDQLFSSIPSKNEYFEGRQTEI